MLQQADGDHQTFHLRIALKLPLVLSSSFGILSLTIHSPCSFTQGDIDDDCILYNNKLM